MESKRSIELKLWEAINQLSKNDDGMYQEQIVRHVLRGEDWLNLTTSAILLNEGNLLGAFDVVAPLLPDMLSVKKLKKCVVTKIVHHRGEFATHEEVEFVSHFEREYREVANDKIGGPYIIEFLKFHSKKPHPTNN